MLVLYLVCGVSKTYSNDVVSVEYLLDDSHNQCWDSFWKILLATVVVLIQISDGILASLSRDALTVIFSLLKMVSFARRVSFASLVAKVRKIKSFVISDFLKFINSTCLPS
jgi:hypothetical protein